jgi:hypothetical protein
MDDRHSDRLADPRPLRDPTRRALLSAAGLLVAAGSTAGLLREDAAARRVRNRRSNRNHNRKREKEISRPGEPGEPGEDGNP